MNMMPEKLKTLLKLYAYSQFKSRCIYDDIMEIFGDYKVPYDNLVCETSWLMDEPSTNALALISNGECGDLDNSIAEIEKVFFHYANIESEN